MNFDRLAPFYRWMESALAGGSLQRCRTAFLDQLPAPRRALLLGEGHGRFLAALLARHPTTEIMVVDGSARMLATAQAAAAKAGRNLTSVTFEQRDLQAWTPPAQSFDLLTAHFLFDCFPPEDLRALITRIAPAATPGAIWLVADFRLPAQPWRRRRARVILSILYRFFGWTTGIRARQLTPPDPLLAHAGFALRQRRLFDWGLLHADLWQA